MRPDIIKTYWQAMDKCGDVYLFHTTKPTLEYGEIWDNVGSCDNDILFPIPLKPPQIAGIKVNENGTWSYKIEREEGYYLARRNGNLAKAAVKYKGGAWYWLSGGKIDELHFLQLTISSTRIPDECII